MVPAPKRRRFSNVQSGEGCARSCPSVGWWHQVEALDLSASMSFTQLPPCQRACRGIIDLEKSPDVPCPCRRDRCCSPMDTCGHQPRGEMTSSRGTGGACGGDAAASSSTTACADRVLTGGERAFTAGLDLKELGPTPATWAPPMPPTPTTIRQGDRVLRLEQPQIYDQRRRDHRRVRAAPLGDILIASTAALRRHTRCWPWPGWGLSQKLSRLDFGVGRCALVNSRDGISPEVARDCPSIASLPWKSWCLREALA